MNGTKVPIYLRLWLRAQSEHGRIEAFITPIAYHVFIVQQHDDMRSPSIREYFSNEDISVIMGRWSPFWMVSGGKCTIKPPIRQRLSIFSRKHLFNPSFWSDKTVKVRLTIATA